MKNLILLISFLSLMLACQKTVQPEATPDHGNMAYVQLDGGFWGIVADSGLRFQPLTPLSPIFQVDGLDVYFEYVIVEGDLTVTEWGQPINIVNIEIE